MLLTGFAASAPVGKSGGKVIDDNNDRVRPLIQSFIEKVGGRWFDSYEELLKWRKEQRKKSKMPSSSAHQLTQYSAHEGHSLQENK